MSDHDYPSLVAGLHIAARTRCFACAVCSDRGPHELLLDGQPPLLLRCAACGAINDEQAILAGLHEQIAGRAADNDIEVPAPVPPVVPIERFEAVGGSLRGLADMLATLLDAVRGLSLVVDQEVASVRQIGGAA